MTLLVTWSNLALVTLPFVLAIGVSVGLAFLLRRAARESGLPRARETCVDCAHEAGLVEAGACEQRCAVNELPALPLALFVGCSTFAILAIVFPAVVLTYVLPFWAPTSTTTEVLLILLIASSVGGAVALALYCLQDLPEQRELLLRGSMVVAIAALAAALLTSGGALSVAEGLGAAALAVILVAAAVDRRARLGRPTLGLRTMGVAVVPLLLVSTLAVVRIVEILQLSGTL